MDNDESNAPIEDAQEQPVQSAGQDATDQQELVEEVNDQVDESQDELVEQDEAVEEQAEEKPSQPSKRENLRIQALVEKMRRQGSNTQSETFKRLPEEMPSALNYKDAIDADDDVIKTLESDREKFGQSLYQRGQSEGLKQAESIQFHTRLEIDAPKVSSKYKQLDKDSEEFNPPVADALNNWYLATVGYDAQTRTVENSNVRYSEFVDGIMELAETIAGEKVQESSKNIAKQAARTSIRPDGSKAKRLNLNQAPQDMTDEELDAYLSNALPKK